MDMNIFFLNVTQHYIDSNFKILRNKIKIIFNFKGVNYKVQFSQVTNSL